MKNSVTRANMKIAVFGCLHGMLNEMFQTVADYEKQTHNSVDFIIVCGDCQTIRHYDDLKCLAVPNRYKQVGDFHEYYSGRKKVPKLTIFVGGNHEASNYLMTLPYGGWVCDNFYYLGYAGVVNYKGLRIAGISGIYNHRNCNRGRYESMPLDGHSLRSIYHTRRLDVFRLQLLSKNAYKTSPIDIFLSHDWPSRIYNHGNCQQLLRFKPLFKKDVHSRNGLGNPLTEPLVYQLRPRRWFAAHLHCRFYAKVDHNKTSPDSDGSSRCTEFLSLNKIGKGRRFVEFLDIPENDSQKSVTNNLNNDDKRSDEQLINDGKPETVSNSATKDDDHLYYDAEWLTVLRTTIDLENNSFQNVPCPDLNDDHKYFPTPERIQQTIDLMNETGGLVIEKNFQMSEPVIYNRPDGLPPSLDENRCKYFSNPQHDNLCARLQIKSLLHQSPCVNNDDDDNQAFELDEDGCLPFYVDKKDMDEESMDYEEQQGSPLGGSVDSPPAEGGDDNNDDDQMMHSLDSDGSDGPAPAPPPIVYEMDMPYARPDLGEKQLFVRMPNFLSVGTQEYHPEFYNDEIDDDDTRDIEGRTKLKLRVENTIRWRRPDDNDPKRVESNARIVEWSDGTMSLYLGEEIFDINEKSIGETSHLFLRMGLRQGLQAQAVFKSKLSIRPNSTESFTHRKLTLSLADRSQKTQKIRMLSNPGQDPEARLGELSKQEEDKMKATMRRETKQRRIQERTQVSGPNASYLEPDYDEEDEDGAISLSAIKRGAMARTNYDSDESSESDEKYSDDSDPEFGQIQRRSDRKQKQVVEESEEE